MRYQDTIIEGRCQKEHAHRRTGSRKENALVDEKDDDTDEGNYGGSVIGGGQLVDKKEQEWAANNNDESTIVSECEREVGEPDVGSLLHVSEIL